MSRRGHKKRRKPRSAPAATTQSVRQIRRILRKEPANHLNGMREIIDKYRPQNRLECVEDYRPCPWVSCPYHLYLDVNEVTGSIKFNFPELEPWELPQTCALDVANQGPSTLDAIAYLMNLSRERVRQIEAYGLSLLQNNYQEDLEDLHTEPLNPESKKPEE